MSRGTNSRALNFAVSAALCCAFSFPSSAGAQSLKTLVDEVRKLSDAGDYEAVCQMKMLYPQLSKNAQALECFGFSDQDLRNMKNAMLEFTAASRLAPQDTHVQVSLVYGLYGIASHREALRRINLIVAANPKDARARAIQALVLQQMGESNDARRALNAAQKLDMCNEVWEAKYNFAIGELNQIETIRVADAYIKALANDVGARMFHAKAMRDAGKLTLAESDLRQVLKAKPNHMTALTHLAEVYRLAKKYQEALNCLERRLKLARTEREMQVTNRLIAEIHEKANNLVAAVVARQRVIAGALSRKKCRNEWEMKDILLCCHDLIALKKYPQTAQLLSLVIEHDPQSVEALEKRAICYAKMQRSDEAIKDYSRLLEIHSDVASWYRHRANLLKLAGRRSEAERDFKRAEQLESEQMQQELP
ncbi:MAG: hypothetical protein C0507_25185 [Cyanobacteria bacterium PR.3.49]|nr:hypothetical protein [Cyanobacteria bacterium PR.3.49]